MINFLKYRWAALAFSVLIFATFIGTYVYKYINNNGTTFNYNVEFTGGIQVLLGFSKPVAGDNIIRILESKGWQGPVTREFSPTEHLVRVKKETTDVKDEAERIRTALQESLSETTVTIKQTDSLSGGMGQKLRVNSIYAVLLSLFLMLLYIAMRFWSFAYAMGAVVSLFHDAIVILAVFLLFDKEISINVIGAILAVLGYSINDTIVIFARIRENVLRLPQTSMEDVINISITETLRRTLLTTFATTLVVVALLVFGGEILRDLSLALLIGIVFGIYSTIFIATPVVLWLYKDDRAVARR
jgi:preprotein translocase subunit SecF